ncbi:MAG: EpsI family protein [Acidobacteria bacterium]|nr:EpsI family protein [Acidobacteriota bacterium]
MARLPAGVKKGDPLNSSSKLLLGLFSGFISFQALGAYFLANRTEYQPTPRPLTALASQLGSWKMVGEYPLEKEVQDVLQATDTLNRIYQDTSAPVGLSLFIAFFKSQRSGVAPHSPKNCLPGNGWVPERSEIVRYPMPGSADGIEVNQYIVQKGDIKNVVVYWYQSHGRVVASEYKAKFFVMADAIAKNRTDTALVKVIAPVVNDDVAGAIAVTQRFVATSFGPISQALPN